MTSSEYWMSNYSNEPEFDPTNSIQRDAYLFGLCFWSDSLDDKGNFINFDPTAYDSIGYQLQLMGLDDETATLITDLTYQDVASLRTGSLSTS